jgi:branched-chain amino acid transport system substrate-binding protein
MKFAAAIVATLVLASAISARAEDIVIGAPVSLTGTYGYVGTDAVKGMQLAIDDINATNKLGDGRKLKLMVEDDGSDRNQAITLINRLASRDKALAIAGPSSTVTALAVAAASNDLQIPMLSIAVSSAVTKAGPWSFHVMAPPSLLMTSLARYVAEVVKPKTVMTIHGRDNEGAVAQVRAARAYLEGKTKLLPEESALMSETDFTALSTKIASANPDVVIIAMADANAASLIVQARQSGVGPNVKFFGNNATASPSFLRIGGAAVEGAFMAADAFPEAREDAVTKEFLAKFKSKYDGSPSQWVAMGYTVVHVLGKAIAGVKGDLSREALRDALKQIKDYPSVLGKNTFSFDAEREPLYDPVMLTVKDGRFAVAP